MSRFLQNLLSRVLAPAPAIQPRLASRYEPAAGASLAAAAPSLAEEHVESFAGGAPVSTPRRADHLATAASSPAEPRSIAPAAPGMAGFQPAIDSAAPSRPTPPGAAPRPPAPSHFPPPSDPTPPSGTQPAPERIRAFTTPSHPGSVLPRPDESARSTGASPASTLFFPHREPKPSRPPFAPAAPPVEPSLPAAPPPAVTRPATTVPPPPSVLPAAPLPPGPVPFSSTAHFEAPPAPPTPQPSIQVTIGRVEIRAMPPPPAPSRPAASASARRPALPLEEYLRRRDAA